MSLPETVSRSKRSQRGRLVILCIAAAALMFHLMPTTPSEAAPYPTQNVWFQNVATGDCLRGQPFVHLGKCDANARWSMRHHATFIVDIWTIRLVADSGACLDEPGWFAPRINDPVGVYYCADNQNNDNQLFFLDNAWATDDAGTPGAYRIRSLKSNSNEHLCLQGRQRFQEPLTVTCNYQTPQAWRIIPGPSTS
jgi:hypothetical protein